MFTFTLSAAGLVLKLLLMNLAIKKIHMNYVIDLCKNLNYMTILINYLMCIGTSIIYH